MAKLSSGLSITIKGRLIALGLITVAGFASLVAVGWYSGSRTVEAAREAETLRVGQDTGRRCRGAGFGRRRIKSPERQIVRARPQSSLCKCEIGVTGYADYGLITEKAAGRCP